MIKTLLTSILLLTMFANIVKAQKNHSSEKFGKTLNLGFGIGGYYGYYSYVEHNMPVFSVNYEFDVAKNFTLAPTISIYTYQSDYYWGNKNHPYQNYHYKETVVPIGVKGTYYFDQLLEAGSDWDFYIAGSLGFFIVNSRWDSTFPGDKNYYHSGSPMYIDLHFGTEYHINKKLGIFADLSTGVSTFGLAIHNL